MIASDRGCDSRGQPSVDTIAPTSPAGPDGRDRGGELQERAFEVLGIVRAQLGAPRPDLRLSRRTGRARAGMTTGREADDARAA